MLSFSKDIDVLKYEPSLFGGLHLRSQVVLKGDSGEINGTLFTINQADFNNNYISAGMVIYLQSADGTLDGAFEIVEVNSTTTITVSVLRADESMTPIAPTQAANINYYICTYQPQSNEVLFELTQRFGIKPGSAEGCAGVENIIEPETLKQCSVYGTLAIAFTMIAWDAKNDKENLWEKHKHYYQLFGKARQRAKVSLDCGVDGVSDVTYSGASARLKRD